MRVALQALLIFVAVSGAVAFYAWSMNRRIAPDLDRAAEEALAARNQPPVWEPPPEPKFTRRQMRVYVLAYVLSMSMLVVGTLLMGRSGGLQRLGDGLAIAGMFTMLLRVVVRTYLGRKSIRLQSEMRSRAHT